MPKPYKQDLPRKWNKWKDEDIYDFIAQTALNSDETDEETEVLIEAMLDELDKRDNEVVFYPSPGDDDFTDEPLDMPSYAS